MPNRLCVVVASIVCLALTGCDGSKCGHDKLKPTKMQGVTHLTRRGGRTLAFEAIRVSVFFDDSYSCAEGGVTGLNCWCKTATDTVPTFGDGTQICNEAMILDTAKKAYIQQTINDAVSWLQGVFKVERGGTLALSAGTCGPGTSGVTIPTAHSTNGVADTDLIIYAVGVPDADGTIASALSCQFDVDNDRPLGGWINFNAKHFTPVGLDTSEHYGNVQTTIHEIFHVFGFASSFFETGKWFNGADPLGANGEITTPEVLVQTRSHFGCDTLTGGAIEQQLGAGTAGSHWEKRTFGNEVMTGTVTSGSRMPVSKVTLAYFKDTGVYDVDYAKADELWWGRAGGCGFGSASNTKSCSEDKSRVEFCWEDADGGTITAAAANNGWCLSAGSATPCLPSMCSFTLEGMGVCKVAVYTDAIPVQFQHFPSDTTLGGGDEEFDFCPAVITYSNRGRSHGVCTDTLSNPCPNLSETSCGDNPDCMYVNGNCLNLLIDIYGNTYGPTSRCFSTSNLLLSLYQHTSRKESRCFRVVCTATDYTIEVAGLGTMSCSGDVSVTGYNGAITCWPYDVVCTGRGETYKAVAATTSEPTPVPTPQPTPVPTPLPSGVTTPEPTPSPTPSPTPVPTPQPTPIPTPLPSGVTTPGPTPSPTPSPTPVPTPQPTPQPEGNTPNPPSSTPVPLPAINHTCSGVMVAETARCLLYGTEPECAAQLCTWCQLGRYFESCLYTGEACGQYQLGVSVVNYTIQHQCPDYNSGGKVVATWGVTCALLLIVLG